MHMVAHDDACPINKILRRTWMAHHSVSPYASRIRRRRAGQLRELNLRHVTSVDSQTQEGLQMHLTWISLLSFLPPFLSPSFPFPFLFYLHSQKMNLEFFQ